MDYTNTNSKDDTTQPRDGCFWVSVWTRLGEIYVPIENTSGVTCSRSKLTVVLHLATRSVNHCIETASWYMRP